MPAKKPSAFQKVLVWALVYLMVSALTFGGYLAANSFTTWLEDKPYRESWGHLTVRSLGTPLMLWAALAATKGIVHVFRREHNKSIF